MNSYSFIIFLSHFLLLLCSSAITEDFYKGFFRPNASQKELVWLGRIMVLVIAAISIVIARDPNSQVLKLVADAWAGFGAAFGPVVILSLFWKRMNAIGALAGMIVGAIVVIGWKPITSIDLYEIIPGFIAAWAAIILASLLSKPISTEVQERFQQSDNAFKQIS